MLWFYINWQRFAWSFKSLDHEFLSMELHRANIFFINIVLSCRNTLIKPSEKEKKLNTFWAFNTSHILVGNGYPPPPQPPQKNSVIFKKQQMVLPRSMKASAMSCGWTAVSADTWLMVTWPRPRIPAYVNRAIYIRSRDVHTWYIGDGHVSCALRSAVASDMLLEA